MYLRRFWRVAMVVALLAAGTATACSPTAPTNSDVEQPDGVDLVFMGFIAGGSMQMRSDAIAETVRLEHPEWHVTSFAPGGEARLQETRILGEADFYLPPVFRPLEIEVHGPLHPDIDYEKATDYRIVLPSSFTYVHLLALDKTGLNDIGDIVERRYPFVMGSGTGIVRLLFDKMLGYYGASIAETEAWGAKYTAAVMAAAEGVEALESGSIDLGFTYASIPHPLYMAVDSNVRLLSISDPGLLQLLEAYGCSPAVIPAGTYPFVDSDVPTVYAQESLATRPDMPDDIVYEVCKAVFAHMDVLLAAHPSSGRQLTPEGVAAAVALAEKNGQSYHPGALKFFREKGWLS
jgi:TRAP transporter TAXI family solute receptor